MDSGNRTEQPHGILKYGCFRIKRGLYDAHKPTTKLVRA